MKKHSLLATLAATVVCVSACSQIPKEAYYTHGQPESLLESTQESVSLSLSGKKSVDRATDVIRKIGPSQAALSCRDKSKACDKVERLLADLGVSTTRVNTKNGKDKVVLGYTDAKLRDCLNRYIDNPINPYNLNHPTFGCSIAANMAQQVTDRREFVEPKVSGQADARKVVQAVDQSLVVTKADTNFSPIVTSETIATSSGSR